MIAITEDRSRKTQTKPTAPTFENLLPAIRKQARRAFRTLPAADREDLIAETIANAFCFYKRLLGRGKADLVYATPLARFAIRRACSGRRVGSKSNVQDVSSPCCQKTKGIKVKRLGNLDETRGRWQEIVVEDKTAGPAEIAATRIDFAAWLRSLTAKQRRIAKTLATGETTTATARKVRVSVGRISQVRRELHEAWLAFHGQLAVV